MLGRRLRQRQDLQARAQLRQGRAQIVRDRIGNIAYAMNEQLDLIEHAVDGSRERIEFIAAVIRRQPMTQIALNDRRDGLANAMDARHQRTPDQDAPDGAKDR